MAGKSKQDRAVLGPGEQSHSNFGLGCPYARLGAFVAASALAGHASGGGRAGRGRVSREGRLRPLRGVPRLVRTNKGGGATASHPSHLRTPENSPSHESAAP
jgi:hypothetical protein